MQILIVVPQQIEDARIIRPSDDEICSFQEAVKCRPPELDGV
jgi:hypothetical protein